MKATPFKSRRRFKEGTEVLDVLNNRIVEVVSYEGRNLRVLDRLGFGTYSRDSSYFIPKED